MNLNHKILTLNMVRHGRTEGNIQKLMSGHTDHQLVQEGIDELLEMKEQMTYPAFDRLYSSDLSRAYRTAEILFEQEVKVENRRYGLREIYFGDIENLHFEGKLQNFYKDFFGDSPKLINAENGPMFQNRVMDELQVIAQEMVHENLDSAMIVAHAGTIRMTHYTFLEIEQKNYRDLEIDNGTGFSFRVAYDVRNRQFQLLDYAPIDI